MQLIREIREIFISNLNSVEWMDDDTRKEAKEKVVQKMRTYTDSPLIEPRWLWYKGDKNMLPGKKSPGE